jgi:hypothetical protein
MTIKAQFRIRLYRRDQDWILYLSVLHLRMESPIRNALEGAALVEQVFKLLFVDIRKFLQCQL